MRAARENARAAWEAKCGSKDVEHVEHAYIAMLYAAYHSLTPSEFFDKRGVLGQKFDTDRRECKTISRLYDKANPGDIRPNIRYTWSYTLEQRTYTVVKSYAWWLLLLHQKEGSELDKFISDAVLGRSWTEVSHKCHWAFCFVVSHLEPVMRIENSDRTVCKNRSRGKDGGCNALHSLHPYDHCLLDMPVGTSFDIELPPPLPGLANGQKVRRSSDKNLSLPLSEFKHDIRGKKSRGIEQLPPLPERKDSNKQASSPRVRLTGPCVYGHTTLSGDCWLRDPAHKCELYAKIAGASLGRLCQKDNGGKTSVWSATRLRHHNGAPTIGELYVGVALTS